MRGGAGLPWSFAGYGLPVTLASETEVDVLTPRAIVAALRVGYRPHWADG